MLRLAAMSLRLPTAIVLAVAALCGCAGSPEPSRPEVRVIPTPAAERGKASWYGDDFRGRPTASGEPYDPDALTAAHPSLSFGTRVRVTAAATGRSVTVRINDRFGGHRGRIIDLSRASFAAIAPLDAGVIDVQVEPLPTR